MSNVLSEEKRQQVIALGRLGWPLRRIEKETGVRRETSAAYLKAAGVAIRLPGAWGRRPPAKPANGVSPDSVLTPTPVTVADHPPSLAQSSAKDPDAGNAKPANEVSPDSEPNSTPVRKPSASICEPYLDFIQLSLDQGRNAKAIYQDLVDDHGFRGRYQSVKRFARQLRTHSTSTACAVIFTAPGEEAQVDYGSGPMVRDPQSGRYRRTRLFVLTLGYSRKAVHLLTFQSSTRIWAELHEQAFRRLGGVPRTIVLDNLGEGVLQADIYDPTLNPLYRDVLTHYGTVALPCRVRDPDRKGKVERGVGYAKNTPLKAKRFESMEEARAYLERWEQNWADTRIHGTTKCQVSARFGEEKPTLLPLPVEPFRHYQFGERRVNLDSCVEVEAAFYSAPPGWVCRTVKVQWDSRSVRLLDPRTGQLLREHLRQNRGNHRIHEEDRPAKMLHSTQQLLTRCARAGSHIGAVAEQMYRNNGIVAIRRILGLLSLARKHGAALTNDACSAALEIGVLDNPYRFAKRWIERRPLLTLRQVDPIIRQLTLYRDFIDNKTDNQTEENSTE
ncbi:MAG: IS21 family transposase [Bryobacterales bacterium]|nr:IS21 family transposase [Bryobacterales bacterium]